MPKVTVFLTSYNHEKYLRESIESVLNQTYTDFELLILDDASTDNSWQIINNYSDPRIRTFRNEINRFGDFPDVFPDEAKGEYIAIHHSDDIWEPTKLEKQVTFLDNNPDIAAVFTHVQVIDERGQPFTDENQYYYDVFDQPNRTRFEWLNYFFYNLNALCHPSLLIRKEIYEEVNYRQGLAQLPDFDIWVQLCLHHEIYIIQEKLTRFRVRDHDSNTSGNRPETRIRTHYDFLKVLDHYKLISSVEELSKVFLNAKDYLNKNNDDILYALGRIAVETGTHNPTKLFGLNLLFEALNDPVRAHMLQKYQLFDEKAFFELSAKNDIFAIEVVRNLNEEIQNLHHNLTEQKKTIKQLNTVISNKDKALAEKDQEILYYALSKSWQITRPLRKVIKLAKRLLKKNH